MILRLHILQDTVSWIQSCNWQDSRNIIWQGRPWCIIHSSVGFICLVNCFRHFNFVHISPFLSDYSSMYLNTVGCYVWLYSHEPGLLYEGWIIKIKLWVIVVKLDLTDLKICNYIKFKMHIFILGEVRHLFWSIFNYVSRFYYNYFSNRDWKVKS